MRMLEKPNLFIIGAAKSGTTALHHHLGAHPDIFLSEPKEPGFFVPELNYYPSDETWYLGLFENSHGARYRGESSTHYTKRPMYEGVPDRIAAFVDDEPRFIYLMRDPIERAISHYLHNVRKHQEHRTIATAFHEVPEYLAVSDYAMQLEPYMERFGRASVFTSTFEAMVERPGATVDQILSWLDLETGHPRGELRKRNARPERFTRVRGRGLLHRLAVSDVWDRLSPYAPRWVRTLGKRAGYRPADASELHLEDVVGQLRPEMRRMVKKLETLLDRSFPEWTTTLGSDAYVDPTRR